jgi:hypothetical protein
VAETLEPIAVIFGVRGLVQHSRNYVAHGFACGTVLPLVGFLGGKFVERFKTAGEDTSVLMGSGK